MLFVLAEKIVDSDEVTLNDAGAVISIWDVSDMHKFCGVDEFKVYCGKGIFTATVGDHCQTIRLATPEGRNVATILLNL